MQSGVKHNRMIVNHYTHYVKCGEKTDRAAVWLSDCLTEGKTRLAINKEILLDCISYLDGQTAPLTYATYCMGRGAGKTSLCVALAVYASFRGMSVYYIPASRNSFFLDLLESAYIDPTINNLPHIRCRNFHQTFGGSVTIGKGRIQVVRDLVPPLEDGLYIFDDFDHNYKAWDQQMLRPNVYKTIGFQSPLPEWSLDQVGFNIGGHSMS